MNIGTKTIESRVNRSGEPLPCLLLVGATNHGVKLARPAHAVERKVFVVLPPNRQSSVRSPDLTSKQHLTPPLSLPRSLITLFSGKQISNGTESSASSLWPLSCFFFWSPRRHSTCCSIYPLRHLATDHPGRTVLRYGIRTA